MDTIKKKADKISENIAKISNSISKKIEKSDKLETAATEVVEVAKECIEEAPLEDSINVSSMLSDFAYVRRVLRENTECARSTLEYVSANLLDDDNSVTPSMLSAFSELNKSIAENMRLFVTSYKELSAAMANIQTKQSVTNNLNIINTEENTAQVLNVKELIDKLKGSK